MVKTKNIAGVDYSLRKIKSSILKASDLEMFLSDLNSVIKDRVGYLSVEYRREVRGSKIIYLEVDAIEMAFTTVRLDEISKVVIIDRKRKHQNKQP